MRSSFLKFATNILVILFSLKQCELILRKVLQTLNLHCEETKNGNIHCEETENGKVAVDYFKKGRIYDLVFMDKEMPVMDGHEVDQFSSFNFVS